MKPLLYLFLFSFTFFLFADAMEFYNEEYHDNIEEEFISQLYEDHIVLKGALFSQHDVQNIRADPAVLLDLFNKRKISFQESLGQSFADLDDDEIFVIYCLMCAHYLTPYGKYYGKDGSLSELLASPTMNCGQYGLLGLQIVENINPEALVNTKIHFIGWGKPSAFGIHQTLLMYKPPNKDLFIDPTAAIIARMDFDSFASGKTLDKKNIISFFNQSNLLGFHNAVYNTFLHGKQKPSALQYYHGSYKRFLRDKTPRHRWVSPSVQRGFVYKMPPDDDY